MSKIHVATKNDYLWKIAGGDPKKVDLLVKANPQLLNVRTRLRTDPYFGYLEVGDKVIVPWESDDPPEDHAADVICDNGRIGTTKFPCPEFCAKSWAAVDAEVKAVLDHGTDADPIERNKYISAAYARLYRANPNLRWAGLAAIVSVQGGCAMKEAKAARSSVFGGDSYAFSAGDAKFLLETLGKANRAIFEDVYPSLLFYQKFGIEGVNQCGDTPGHRIPPDLKKGLRLFEQHDLRGGSNKYGDYEQGISVQQRVYVDSKVATLLKNIQDKANDTGIFSPLYRAAGVRKPEIPLSTTCGDPNTIPIGGSINDPNVRVAYYGKLMDAFEKKPPPPEAFDGIIKAAP
jgi:hypothetical protein